MKLTKQDVGWDHGDGIGNHHRSEVGQEQFVSTGKLQPSKRERSQTTGHDLSDGDRKGIERAVEDEPAKAIQQTEFAGLVFIVINDGAAPGEQIRIVGCGRFEKPFLNFVITGQAVDERPSGKHLRFSGENIFLLLKRSRHHPIQWKQHRCGKHNQQDINDYFARHDGVLILHPSLGDVPVDDRDNEDDEKQNPGGGRGEAHAKVFERLLKDVQTHRGRTKLAAGHDERSLEFALQAANDGDDEDEERDRREHGHGDVPQLLPSAGAVDGGRFMKLGGNLLKTREVEDHANPADARPRAHDHQCGLGPGVTGQPFGPRNAHQAERAVDHAVVDVEHHLPQENGADPGTDRGQKECGAKYHEPPNLLVQQHREQQRCRHIERDRHHQEDRVVK